MTESPNFTPEAARRIEILAFPRVQLLDVTGPLQVFATANDLAQRRRAAAPYALAVVAAQGLSLETSAGLSLVVAPLPGSEREVDTLIVAGGYGVDAAVEDAALVAWLRERSARPRRVASVCSGALLLAAAGVLSGRRAATHRGRCAQLADLYLDVRVENDPIFVRDGHVWTSAGVTAGIVWRSPWSKRTSAAQRRSPSPASSSSSSSVPAVSLSSAPRWRFRAAAIPLTGHVCGLPAISKPICQSRAWRGEPA